MLGLRWPFNWPRRQSKPPTPKIVEGGEIMVYHGPYRWEVTEERTLLFNGRNYAPYNPEIWTADRFAERIRRMKALIQESPHDIKLLGLQVEEHVAIALWNEGALTVEHLRAATRENSGFVVDIELGGERILLTIRRSMYYENYQFLIEGHPEGFEVARDVPDALAAVAGEKTF